MLGSNEKLDKRMDKNDKEKLTRRVKMNELETVSECLSHMSTKL